jgi:hypothetical protein
MTDEEIKRLVDSRVNEAKSEFEAELSKMRTEQKDREIRNLKSGLWILLLVLGAVGSWVWAQIQHLLTLRIG